MCYSVGVFKGVICDPANDVKACIPGVKRHVLRISRDNIWQLLDLYNILQANSNKCLVPLQNAIPDRIPPLDRNPTIQPENKWPYRLRNLGIRVLLADIKAVDVANRQVFLVLAGEVHRARGGVRLIREISNTRISEAWLVAIANRKRRQVVHHLIARTPRVYERLSNHRAVLTANKVILRDGDNVFRQALKAEHKRLVTVKAHRAALRPAHQTWNRWRCKRCRNAKEVPFEELRDVDQLRLALWLLCLNTVGLNDGIRVNSTYILLRQCIAGRDVRPVWNRYRNTIIR